jgi:hypothetical protein
MNIRLPHLLTATLAVGLLSIGSFAYPDTVEDHARLRDIIESVRQGWVNADGAPFREHFLDFDGARYFEGGGENTGLDDLIDNHVKPEANAFEDFELNFSNVQTHIEADFAWALVDYEIKAKFKGDERSVHNRGHGTYLFRRIAAHWKVVHTHSASRPVEKPTGR